MTIMPLLKYQAFDPQAIEALGAAYDKACQSLNDGGQAGLVRDVIAKRIIELAQSGERDPDRLCASALASLGITT